MKGRPSRSTAGIVKLTSSSSIDPQDAGLQPVVNPPCWASKTAVSFNLTIPEPVPALPLLGQLLLALGLTGAGAMRLARATVRG